MARLEFYDGDRLVFQHKLGPGRTVIGRSDGCDLWLDGEALSRRHATIARRADGWWLVDRSRHGTFVNGEPVQRAALADGDLVRFGNREARFFQDQKPDEVSTTRFASTRQHDEPVAVDADGLTVAQATAVFTRGPRAGEHVVLDRARISVGGGEDDGLHLPGAPPHVADLQVARGRAVLVSHAFPVAVAGLPAPAMLPVLDGEEVSVGPHAFEIRTTFDRVDTHATRFGQLVGQAPAMRTLFATLQRIAAHDHPVLLVGESGTGKELAAEGLHVEGGRADGPFVAVNCAALPDTLIESELFGHEKGAFTGASKRQDGAFQRAHGGTLFLDEVGELKLDAQAKLLRALESREVRRVGGTEADHPDVRVVAATNRDLGRMVRSGTFRADLLFRLSVLTVPLPPLRERLDDVPLLADTLLRRTLPGAELSDEALTRLKQHAWPGNVRELRNVLTRAYVFGGPHIHPDSITFGPLGSASGVVLDGGGDDRARLVDALAQAGGNKAKAARILGIPRSSLLYRLRKHGLG